MGQPTTEPGVEAVEPDNRSLAQFFFEIGYGACWAEAYIRNNEEPPFPLSDGLIERAWEISAEAYDDPAEFDPKRALAEAAPELLEVVKDMLPANVCITNPNIRDDLVVPMEVTMGELRKIAAVIAKAQP